MYSWEITNTMEAFNYSLPSNVYLDLTQNSPQINRIMFSAGNDQFEIWDDEGGYWMFKVYYDAA